MFQFVYLNGQTHCVTLSISKMKQLGRTINHAGFFSQNLTRVFFIPKPHKVAF